jgi:hypothetical protein
MLSRFLPLAFLLCGIGLLGAAGVVYLAPAEAPSLCIEDPDRELPGVAAGQKLDVAFRIHNRAGQSARIIGLTVC